MEHEIPPPSGSFRRLPPSLPFSYPDLQPIDNPRPIVARRKENRMGTPAEGNLEASKLDALASTWGLSTAAFVEEYALDDVVPGICMNPDCGYTTEVEPDQREGWCKECETRSVRSGISLSGLI
jgi:hypothetical protein